MNIKKTVCQNPWCKATFEFKEDVTPQICNKCKSFDRDLSGGITWTEKKYEGSRFDDTPHQIKIDVRKYLK